MVGIFCAGLLRATGNGVHGRAEDHGRQDIHVPLHCAEKTVEEEQDQRQKSPQNLLISVKSTWMKNSLSNEYMNRTNLTVSCILVTTPFHGIQIVVTNCTKVCLVCHKKDCLKKRSIVKQVIMW
ncbi:hypothetical protein AVEN_234713-1 [Araneus ventricosus]|uniref:Uncharacterized protein n=1 Tax=Araneus ventricosus TaxID=182803 RepID=A0A4Y2IIB4_ARAVE|nr:hypothetical protein AVEN_234713-1 [Araneus ventricosus]